MSDEKPENENPAVEEDEKPVVEEALLRGVRQRAHAQGQVEGLEDEDEQGPAAHGGEAVATAVI